MKYSQKRGSSQTLATLLKNSSRHTSRYVAVGDHISSASTLSTAYMDLLMWGGSASSRATRRFAPALALALAAAAFAPGRFFYFGAICRRLIFAQISPEVFHSSFDPAVCKDCFGSCLRSWKPIQMYLPDRLLQAQPISPSSVLLAKIATGQQLLRHSPRSLRYTKTPGILEM